MGSLTTADKGHLAGHAVAGVLTMGLIAAPFVLLRPLPGKAVFPDGIAPQVSAPAGARIATVARVERPRITRPLTATLRRLPSTPVLVRAALETPATARAEARTDARVPSRKTAFGRRLAGFFARPFRAIAAPVRAD